MLDRDELQTTLRVICKILEGCDLLLPIWTESPILIHPFESCVSSITPIIGNHSEITMPDGSNVKYFLVQIMEALQTVMLKNVEDDTKSLTILRQVKSITQLSDIFKLILIIDFFFRFGMF